MILNTKTFSIHIIAKKYIHTYLKKYLTIIYIFIYNINVLNLPGYHYLEVGHPFLVVGQPVVAKGQEFVAVGLALVAVGQALV